MITANGGVFKLDTKRTTYLFRVLPTGALEHIYYGKKIDEKDFDFIEEKSLFGCGVKATGGSYANFPDCASFEMSSCGRGDFREPFVIIETDLGSAADFRYIGYQLLNDFTLPDLPCSNNKSETLCITLKDEAKKLTLHLYYSLTDGSDIIVKSASLTNDGDKKVVIRRLMSSEVDILDDGFYLDTLDGAWARERNIFTNPLSQGITKIDSKYGFSSAMHNPYCVLRAKDCTCFHGECYGFNLVYSGNHAEYFDKSIFGKVRVLQGINDSTFSWQLNAGDTFYTPEATVCYSAGGTNDLMHEYHHFISEHIVRGFWQKKERPILCNNWEATGVDFTEEDILRIAGRAKEVGAELFVLDDGWFGARTNCARGLGDWTVNTNKLPHGLKGLTDKLDKMGLSFGIWVEPEMVNPDSDLYRAHPDWAVQNPDYTPLLSRDQLVLDLCNDKVCDYIIEAMSAVFSSANIAYVKWDCNRNITEWYSPMLKGRQGEFHHRYMLGFYKVIGTLTKRFPKILFESCSAGGNRVDMGILCYAPQYWASDNTDSFDRAKIQEGTLTCYPQSTMGAHVSASPNKQTLRQSTIENRFNTACIGAFGYELDLSELSANDTKAVIEQIKWYKKYRKTLQFGRYYRLKSVFSDRYASWIVVSEDKTQAIINITNKVQEIYAPQVILKAAGLDENARYEIKTRTQYFPFDKNHPLTKPYFAESVGDKCAAEAAKNATPRKSEEQCYILSGKTLMDCGIRLNTEWMGGQDVENARIMYDFGSRLYSIEKKVEKND